MSTKIEWATEVWNPVTGCTPISEGCQNCYAKRMAQRLKGRFGYPEDEPFRVTFHIDKLDQPHRWKKPRQIFVCSMGDLFHESVKGDWMWRILDSAFDSPSYHRHIFLFLTKHPKKMAEEMNNWMRNNALSSLPKRWWLGVSVESDKYRWRIEDLIKIPAAKRFVSYEPALGPLDVGLHLGEERYVDCGGCKSTPVRGQPYCPRDHKAGGIDWVIAGCESGPNRRPAKIEWFRDLKNQCVGAGVAYFLKQMEGLQDVKSKKWGRMVKSGVDKMPYLDGQIWDQMPQELSSNP